ncbi:adenine phosphoribosyltransferase [Bifidobacterium apri]|uniref:Adenine phosphoribosyltransferase n=1 Tax=Bifidobacterium apri TaxID=1769423 RepID=A0A6A2W2U4_9BIFI|nr:adenine phosphoribosyltransferase [Bifidobacterium apri]KAB8296646.1 adenine phosphoribosyltransferase [Bifidobacterium apri]
MASDIHIRQLELVGKDNAEYLASLFRSVLGFPKEGINFRDFMPVLENAKGLQILLEGLEKALPVPADSFDSVAGLEARGFLFGPALAARLGKGFIAVRKAGKLPPPVIGEDYTLEYGQARVEVESDAVSAGERVLIVDDLIATGGTAKAAADLIRKCGGTIAGFSFVMQLEGLDGIDSLGPYPTSTLVSMPA